ncbi:MAG: BACON domain-containing protein, partial [Flavobacteriaceae bacterium]|nr:BACON domain-containing protein [Flavobacteriaceae bacterium]
YTGYNLSTRTITNTYTDTGVLQQVSIQDYDRDSNGIINHYIPISNEMNGSDGINIKTNSTYIFNKVSLSSSEDTLKNINALYLPIQTDTYKNGILLEKSKVIYTDWGLNDSGTANIIEQESIHTSKGAESLEPRLVYHDYDSYGNPLEVSKTDGTHVVYIWGYEHTMPIAKIENAKQDDFITDQNNKIAAAITASDNDSSETLENTLRVKLEDLRLAFGDSQVTAYTYDPLIGVTSMTDPSGYTSFYVYDDFNRLQYIKDKDGIVLKSYKYHYKGQEEEVAATTYTVTNEIDGGVGSVSITPIYVESGSYSDITATPGSGYEIDYIKVGTTSYPFTNNTARIDNITSDTEVHVQFKTLTVALTVNPTVLFFEDIDVNKTITVTSGGSWTVSKSDSWIIISTTTGSGNGTFTIRPLKNLGSLRTGTVTVSDGSGSTSITISIEQLGGGGPL